MRKSLGAVLSAALLGASFLCLGMGMDMGSAWAPREDHSCCPGQKPEAPSDTNCCLLLPGAASAPVTLPPPVLTAALMAPAPAPAPSFVAVLAVPNNGPPGASSPGFAAPAAPRAPPAA